MKNDVVVPVLASAVGLLGALLIALSLFWIIKSTRKSVARKSRSARVEITRQRFSYAEVVKMTNNFRRVIGQGAFGTVYHGLLDDVPVAVKLYRNDLRGFETELKYLNKVHHKNLINLIGYCEESTKSALVFEFMANGDLRKNLKGNGSKNLTWERRLGIAIDMAKALDYLHDGCEQQPIIHRDLNGSNILLSENFDVKLSGFALAVHFIPSHLGDSHISIDVAGTYGYIDPRYLRTGQLTVGTDVYAYGAVLVEIITGKPASQIVEVEQYGDLTQWVSSIVANGEVGSIVDPTLEGNYDINSVDEALKVAMACLSHNSNDRPTMPQLLPTLKHCLQMETARFNQSISFNNPTN